ncbi:MAG: ribosomal protein S18-alanine N-acetyltransferase [Gammaproteobacteria bacterium]
MNAVIKAPHARVRPLTVADLEAVMSIENSAYEFPWSIGIFRDCLKAGYDGWCLDIDETLIGYSVLSRGAGEAHILNITITPEQQGKGYGRKLLEHMQYLAKRYQVECLLLEVRSSNKAAKYLYESSGFNEIGRRPGYYPASQGREDAVIFAYVP